jgi:peptidylprolyl isomerase
MPAVSRGPIPILMLCAALTLAIAGCGSDDSSTSSSTSAATESTTAEGGAASVDLDRRPQIAVPNGQPPKQLEEKEIVEGDGPEAKPGDYVSVQYAGVGYESGEEFDASWNRGEPFSFTLGASEVIKGWDQGIAGMKVGGRRELIIPPGLAYGPTGSPPVIGQNETLIFVVDLIAVEKG